VTREDITLMQPTEDLIFSLHYMIPKCDRLRRCNPEDLERALKTILNGDVGLNTASREYCVAKATLERH
jgi:hypothetical protein